MSYRHFNFNMTNRSSFSWQLISLNVNKSFSAHLTFSWCFFLLCSLNFVHKACWSSLCNVFQSIHPFHFVTIMPLTWARAVEFQLVFPTSQLLNSKPFPITTAESNRLMLCCFDFSRNDPQLFPSAVLVQLTQFGVCCHDRASPYLSILRAPPFFVSSVLPALLGY